MIIVALFFSILYYKYDVTRKKIFAWPTIFFIVFYSLSFDFVGNPQIHEYVFEYFSIELTLRSYFFFFVTCISFFIGIYLTRCYGSQFYYGKVYVYSKNRLRVLYYFFSLCAFIGFTINISRVIGNMSLLFVSPRSYEALFGASSLINYLYFLNVPALIIWVYLHNYKISVKYGAIINIFLVLISFFHGIKFTIFDTISYPCLFSFLLKPKVSLKKVAIVIFLLIGIFILFSMLIRGSDGKSPLISLLLYIIPNYYNLDYFVESLPQNWGDFMILVTPDLITSPTYAIGEREWPESSFIFNPAYNMPTSLLMLYLTFNLIGPVVYIFIFALQYNLYRYRNYSLYMLFMSTYMEYCLLFSFYFYAYTKFKNVYYVIVMICVDYFCRLSNQKQILNPPH